MDSIFYLLLISISVILYLNEIIADINIERDAKLSTPEIIIADGYPSEVHNIKTEDGYILEVHRIPAPGKKPVLFMHGLLDSSASCVILGPKRALGYILFDLGYDVWCTNARGNDYSTRHVKHRRNRTREERKKYFNFSWHEIGKYDLPMTIDYILEKSNHSQLHYIGHSQGATAFFVMISERPEYNEKISLMTAMAPPVFMGNHKNELMLLFVRYLPLIETIVEWLGLYEFSRQTNELFLHAQNSVVCYLNSLRNTQLCKHNFSPLVGNLTKHVNRSIVPILETHAPSEASMKQFFHYCQLVQTHRFCQFDYGLHLNLRIYHRPTPPDYNLKNCTAKVAIIYSEQDTIVPAVDVRRLSIELPNVLEIRRVDDDNFNHIDFVWASDAKELVYDYIIGWMRSIEIQNDNE